MTKNRTQAENIVAHMLENDAFSQWLNVELVSITPGAAIIRCEIASEMLNGFSIAHGGISYSLADSALAFAANGYGAHCKSIETSISHLLPCKQGDILTAEATELQRGFKTGLYQVEVFNQSRELIAYFKGTVYISSKQWSID